MGRPPCCDKVGIKKGPWTPEEDIILVSYIQEHGPGNWRSVPTNTGLSRCSKSCRLRWTNYLRPGIKRGNFTPHEEGMIIHLQALLGNKWAAIASYLPQRTDNDIKNYWNTHLKKKLKKFQAALEPSDSTTTTTTTNTGHHHHHHQYLSSISKSFSDRSLDISSNHASSLRLSTNSHNNSQSSSSTTYASSTENISRLLEGWMRSSPKQPQVLNIKDDQIQEHLQSNDDDDDDDHDHDHDEFENSDNKVVSVKKSASVPGALNLLQLQQNIKSTKDEGGGDMVSHEEFDSILSFENAAWDKSTSTTCDSLPAEKNSTSEAAVAVAVFSDKNDSNNNINRQKSTENSGGAPPLSFLEKWLLDENVGQVEDMMELSPMF